MRSAKPNDIPMTRQSKAGRCECIQAHRPGPTLLAMENLAHARSSCGDAGRTQSLGACAIIERQIHRGHQVPCSPHIQTIQSGPEPLRCSSGRTDLPSTHGQEYYQVPCTTRVTTSLEQRGLLWKIAIKETCSRVLAKQACRYLEGHGIQFLKIRWKLYDTIVKCLCAFCYATVIQ